MYSKFLLFFLKCLYLLRIVRPENGIILKDIRCQVLDTNFLRLDKCEYKINAKNIEELYIMGKPRTEPIRSCHLQIQFKVDVLTVPMKFNATYDACAFVENRMKNRVFKRLYDQFARPYMNVGHPCPYDHTVYFRAPKQMPNSVQVPWPSGEYNFSTSWILNQKNRIKIGGIIEFYNKYQKKT